VRRINTIEGSTKRLETVITMNDKATRIAEAIAKPVAARPERSEGHAQIQKIILDKFKQEKGMNDGN
jgi:hypothetical protein